MAVCHYGDDFVVAVPVVAAVVVYFEYIDFAVFAAGAAYPLFVDCVPTVFEFLVVVVVVAVVVALDDVVVAVAVIVLR